MRRKPDNAATNSIDGKPIREGESGSDNLVIFVGNESGRKERLIVYTMIVNPKDTRTLGKITVMSLFQICIKAIVLATFLFDFETQLSY